MKSGYIAELDDENTNHIEKYQFDIINYGVRLSNCTIQEGNSITTGIVHEKLLAIYTCAGLGLEVENELWQMKLSGKEPNKELCDVVLAICASQKEVSVVNRLLARIETMGSGQRKMTLSWLLRDYVKGGYYSDASDILMKMFDLGLCPDYLDRVAVLQGLGKSVKESGSIELYMKLCKRLCLVYL